MHNSRLLLLLFFAVVTLASLTTSPLYRSKVATGSAFQPLYDACLSSLSLAEDLEFIALDAKYGSGASGELSGRLGKDESIRFRSEAFRSKSLRYARMISFAGNGYDVFNFVALPRPNVDLPIFGADIVVLPGGALAAIDFQPLCESPSYFKGPLYAPLSKTFNKWSKVFPSGGAFPPAAARFFSPYALWTRLPSSASIDGVGEALIDYINTYSSLLTSTSCSDSQDDPSRASRHTYLVDYLNYRIANDPAKNMLVGAFGKEWTEDVLRRVMFPL